LNPPANHHATEAELDEIIRADDSVSSRDDIEAMVGPGHVAYAGGWTEQPTCPRCGHTGPFEDYVNGWFATRIEPQLTCVQCDYTALLGDWDVKYSICVTNCGVHLRDWPSLPAHAPTVFAEALRRIGERPRYIVGKL
jgi:hypothetical protein